MSFAVWTQKPPFAGADLNPGELVYQVGAYWVVTDKGAPTQQQVDRVVNAETEISNRDQALLDLDAVVKEVPDGPLRDALRAIQRVLGPSN